MVTMLTNKAVYELIVFQVGDLLCGVEIRHVQEINKHLEITTVYHAPSYVRGVVNLRGHIVTVLDLRETFGLTPQPLHNAMRIVMVNLQGEPVGLLVDGVHDVVRAEGKDIQLPPANVSGVSGRFFVID
jgi:purine-binding chemotaxis protein CheW